MADETTTHAETEDQAPYRNDLAVVVHKEAKILVLQMSGYEDNIWRVPQGPDIMPLHDDVELRLGKERCRQARENKVMHMLAAQLGIQELSYLRYTGIRKILRFGEAEKTQWDSSATHNIHIGKTLLFYIAELHPRQGSFILGDRIMSTKFVSPRELDDYLKGEELRGVEDVLARYMIDV